MDRAGILKNAQARHVRVELTERCNNDCIHCYINRPEHDPQALHSEMSTATVINFLEQACELGCLRVTFTGGEPLLRHDFRALYTHARRLGFIITLFTNGRLIDSEWIELFVEMPPGRPIELTTYGMTAAVYDRVVRRQGAFAEFENGIDLLRRRQVPFVVKMAVLNENKHQTDLYKKWLAGILPQAVPGFITDLNLRVRRDDPARDQQIRQQRISAEEALALFTDQPQARSAARDFCREFAGSRGAALFHCGMGENIAVDAYGMILGCLLLRDPELQVPLQDGALRFAIEEFFPQRVKRTAGNSDYLFRCARCSLFGYCDQCPAQSYLEYGVLDAPVAHLCSAAHLRARQFGLIPADIPGWEIRR